MCGLLGIGGPRGPELVRQRIGDLRHRGPDGEGVRPDPELTLGFRRLAIIGTDDGGLQPMASPSIAEPGMAEAGAGSGHRSFIVFNGEIYNYRELADELEAAGRPVDRRYDTAILLAALEQWGKDALPRLNGMFAFAWYRPQDRRVLLARDRWGKKPLFWGRIRLDDGSRVLAFASELRVLGSLPGGPPEVDPLGVARYLVYDGLAGTRTTYRGIHKLRPGTWLELDPEGTEQASRRFVAYRPRPRLAALGIDRPVAALEALQERLSRAVDLRLRSDVPVGLFLSGGLDSSILAALWRRLRPDEPLHTFTVGFEESSFDERGSARMMAEAIDAEHHEIVATGDDLIRALDDVWKRLSEPFADPSIVPTSMLCRFARERVVVALGGDGADELQAGYDPFRAWKAARFMERMLPRRFWQRALQRLERLLPPSAANNALRFRVRHLAQGFGHPADERIQGWMASMPLAMALVAMKPELAEQVDVERVLEPSRRAYRAGRPTGELNAQIVTWVETYLETSILTKIDRASMLHSLEVRAPFLDPDVAELLSALPPRLVFRGGRGKQLLRRMAASLLPPALMRKPKKGLGVPQAEWLRTVLRTRVETGLDYARHDGWFDHGTIAELWREHLAGTADYRRSLWSFVFASPFQGMGE